MSKQTRFVVFAAAFVAVVLMVATQGVSQDKPQKPEKDPMAEMMAKWAELNALGPQHENFKKRVGTWDVESRTWMGPGAEPVVSKATAEFRLKWGGRFVEQRYKCEAPAFEGFAIEGYDNVKKQYVSMWIDSLSTGIFVSYGTPDETGKEVTYIGKMDDPMTGVKDKVIKMVGREVSDDEAVFVMYDKAPDGTEYKHMEMKYTRRK